MNKKKIILASILKPVNDVRMYEKFGLSLRDSGAYEVHIIGYDSKVPEEKGIYFYPFKKFARLSIHRQLASWNIYKLYIKVKPEVIIVNTHELLIVTLIYKILFGTKILYDIQENYFRNIWYQHNFYWGLKHALAIGVRIKERCLIPFYNQIIVAETGYVQEMPYLPLNTEIILNKCKILEGITTISRQKKSKDWVFIFSGTIAEVYGIKEAIHFYKAIKAIESCKLIIIGHCPDKQLYNNLILTCAKDDNITLHISLSPVSHTEIVKAYQLADYALTPYQYNLSIMNCIPVKFYEYLGYNLPFILPDYNPYWKEFLSEFNSNLFIDFDQLDTLKILAYLNKNIDRADMLNSQIYWESEAIKLSKVLN